MLETRLDGESKDIVSENIHKIMDIFPEVVSEGKIDFDKLKILLGVDENNVSYKFEFLWPGKEMAIKESQKQSTGTLRPCKDESKNWYATQNLYIEGDNLEILKLLQKTYYNQAKMIYLDPPYNTGNDIIYQNDYKDNLETYLNFTNQIKDLGERERAM